MANLFIFYILFLFFLLLCSLGGRGGQRERGWVSKSGSCGGAITGDFEKDTRYLKKHHEICESF